MTLLELVKHLRESILDDTGGTGVDWENISEDSSDAATLRWSNEELTRFINEAEKKVCRSSLLLKSADPVYSVSITAGTANYSLDPRIIRIKGAFLNSNGKEIFEIEYEDLMTTSNWRTRTGTPKYFIADEDSQEITLYPSPIEDDTLNLLVYRLPTQDMDWNLAVIATPDIPEKYQIDMLSYAAHLAYNKDEANTFDPNRSEYFRQIFEKNFSDNSAYTETRRSRTRNRPVRYSSI